MKNIYPKYHITKLYTSSTILYVRLKILYITDNLLLWYGRYIHLLCITDNILLWYGRYVHLLYITINILLWYGRDIH